MLWPLLDLFGSVDRSYIVSMEQKKEKKTAGIEFVGWWMINTRRVKKSHPNRYVVIERGMADLPL